MQILIRLPLLSQACVAIENNVSETFCTNDVVELSYYSTVDIKVYMELGFNKPYQLNNFI